MQKNLFNYSFIESKHFKRTLRREKIFTRDMLKKIWTSKRFCLILCEIWKNMASKHFRVITNIKYEPYGAAQILF